MGDTWSTRVVHHTGYGAIPMLHIIQTEHQGGKTNRCGGIVSTTPHHSRIIRIRASYQELPKKWYTWSKILNHKPPIMIREIQLQARNKLSHIFNTMQLEKTHTTVLPWGSANDWTYTGDRHSTTTKGCHQILHHWGWLHIGPQWSHKKTPFRTAGIGS